MRTLDSQSASSLGYAVGFGACPIALLVGDLDAVEKYAGLLLEHSSRHGLAAWEAWSRCHQGVLALERGDVETGLRLLRAGLDKLGVTYTRFIAFLIAEALGRARQISEGLAAIEETIDECERTEEHWLIAERFA